MARKRRLLGKAKNTSSRVNRRQLQRQRQQPVGVGDSVYGGTVALAALEVGRVELQCPLRMRIALGLLLTRALGQDSGWVPQELTSGVLSAFRWFMTASFELSVSPFPHSYPNQAPGGAAVLI